MSWKFFTNATTVAKLYAAIRVTKGLPWPKRLFLDALNAGLAQGFYSRPGNGGDLADFDSSKDEAIVIESTPPKPAPRPTGGPKPVFPGYESPEAELQIHELQDLEEYIGKLNSVLSGCDMRVVVKIRAKAEAADKSKAVAELLEKIKKGWGVTE